MEISFDFDSNKENINPTPNTARFPRERRATGNRENLGGRVPLRDITDVMRRVKKRKISSSSNEAGMRDGESAGLSGERILTIR